MTWNSIMGLISSVALLLPAAFIVYMRLYIYKSFPFLLVYYMFVFIYNLLTEGYINLPQGFVQSWGMLTNLFDAPLMLMFLTYFSPSARLKKQMKLLVAGLLGFELVMLAIKGFNLPAITIMMAPGLLSVFLFCIYFFIRQTKITIMHRKATGKALIAASLLFAYGCYTIIYLMYYVFKTQHVADTFLVYFLVTTFSSLLMCLGIIIERKRVQRLAELIITRKELSIIYTEARPAMRLTTAGFEKESYN